jgi:nucleoside-diphosphate-sugar epimerase
VNACLENKDLEYFCHVSSVATLGRTPTANVLDENSHWIPGKHNSNYAVSKYGAEREVWRAIAEGLPAVIVNPSIILGYGDWTKGSLRIFKQVYDGLPFYTTGSSGFVDVEDVVDAMIYLKDKEIIAERFILNNQNISFKELFQLIADGFKISAPSRKANAFILSMAWRFEWLISKFNGKAPNISKETAYSAQQLRNYSADKITKAGFVFRNIENEIEKNCKLYIEELRD